MLMNKLRTYAGVVLVAVLIGAGGLSYRAAGQPLAPAPGAGQPPAGGLNQAPQAESRPLTELELLRREVDILKARVELLEERQRAQEAGSRAPQGRPGGRPGMAPGTMGPGGAPQGAPGMAPGGFPEKRTDQRTAPQAPGRPGADEGTEVQPPVYRGSAPDTESIIGLPTGGAAGVSRPGATQRATAPAKKRTDDDSVIRAQPGGGTATKAGNHDTETTITSPDDEIDAAVKAIREARDEDAKRRAVDALEKALKELRRQGKPAGNYRRGPP